MASLVVNGGKQLKGELHVQGSKNSVLPIMAASILNKGVSVIENCPRIEDVFCMIELMESIGCLVTFHRNQLQIDATEVSGNTIQGDCVSKVRSSVIMLGAMLGRKKEVLIDYPGGCSIGARPINFHLEAFQKMKVEIVQKDSKIFCKCNELEGIDITLDFPSVGATENIILAAVLAKGNTNLHNAAREPEILELCRFLKQMGAKIKGQGTGHIIIAGVKELHDTVFHVASDRIVTGTYACAVVGAGGNVVLQADCVNEMDSILPVIVQLGCQIQQGKDYLKIQSNGMVQGIEYLMTKPHPGFPTDMQSQVMSLLAVAQGKVSVIEESIFEARFKTAPELIKMGGDVKVLDRKAVIFGVESLHGTEVEAYDLRGGAALVLAGLVAKGKTTINGVKYIERGYENIVEDLKQLGASIERL